MKTVPDGYWTYERCLAEALKYETRRDFRAGSSAYFRASEKRWLREICRHMKRLGGASHRFVYLVTDHAHQTVYVGLTSDPKRRERDHRYTGPCAMLFRNGAKMTVFSELLPSNEAAELEIQTVSLFRAEGFFVLNKMRGGGLGGKPIWTIEKCTSEASKYATRTEFAKGSSGAYTAAWVNSWLDRVCVHMPKRKRRRLVKWDKPKIYAEAAKYRSRTDFAHGSSGAYQCAWKQGWLDLACLHMKPLR
jgi:predicted GIY-YIG superfamily endonuclease